MPYLTHPHLPRVIYNQIHVVQLNFTPTFPQQHYPLEKSKHFPPLLVRKLPPKTPYLSTSPYLSCIPPTSGHEPYSCHRSLPLQLTSSDPPYHHK